MQTFDQIVDQTRNLPESIQREILHFVEFIVTKYRSAPVLEQQAVPDAFAIYQSLDLGQGGYAKAPSNRAKHCSLISNKVRYAMKKQWVALLCFGVSACTPLSGVNGNDSTHSSIQNPQPHGKVMNTADQKSPLTVRDGWLAFLPNEPSVVTRLQNHADAGIRSAYYTRLTQVLSARSASIAVADAKAFLAQGGGYVYLARGDEISNPDYPGYMIYGDERAVGDMPIIPVDVSPETKRKYPAGVAPDEDLHTTCPKSKRLYVQGTGIQNTYPNELANSAWVSLSSAAMLYGRAWNRAMMVACIDEVARSKPILPENSQVRFNY